MDSQWIADQLLELTRKVADTAGAVEVLNIRADNLEDALEEHSTTQRQERDTNDERRFALIAAIVGAVVGSVATALASLISSLFHPSLHH